MWLGPTVWGRCVRLVSYRTMERTWQRAQNVGA